MSHDIVDECAAADPLVIPGRIKVQFAEQGAFLDNYTGVVAVPGHWEGDLLMGKNGKSAIGTLVELSTRFVLLHLPNGYGALQVQQAIIEATQKPPGFIWKSLTWDQGHEMRNHLQIKVATGFRSTSATRPAAAGEAQTKTPTACSASSSQGH